MNTASRGTTGPGTFIRLLEMIRPDLVRFAFWLARDRSVAEDVVQETLIRAWKSRDELKDPAAARPWLFTIARREHARLYERKRLPTVDVEEVEALLAELPGVDREKVLLMPQGVTREELAERGPVVAEACKERGFRYCPRLHVELYGNRRGT